MAINHKPVFFSLAIYLCMLASPLIEMFWERSLYLSSCQRTDLLVDYDKLCCSEFSSGKPAACCSAYRIPNQMDQVFRWKFTSWIVTVFLFASCFSFIMTSAHFFLFFNQCNITLENNRGRNKRKDWGAYLALQVWYYSLLNGNRTCVVKYKPLLCIKAFCL